jgi:hypothetical protein
MSDEPIAVTMVFFADLRRILLRGGETGPQRYRVRSAATVADLLDTIGHRARHRPHRRRRQ